MSVSVCVNSDSENSVCNTTKIHELHYFLAVSFEMNRVSVLFLRLDQAFQLEKAVKNLKERLAIRYALYNGLNSGEIADGRIEHLDPVENRLFLPWRHWKHNCICKIDAKTVHLQVEYSGTQEMGPLLVSNKGGHYSREGIYYLVNHVARRTNIPNKKGISPRTLKRTFAREYLRTPGNTVAGLQKQFGHKHLWSTAHYLPYVLDEVEIEQNRMIERIESYRKVLEAQK